MCKDTRCVLWGRQERVRMCWWYKNNIFCNKGLLQKQRLFLEWFQLYISIPFDHHTDRSPSFMWQLISKESQPGSWGRRSRGEVQCHVSWWRLKLWAAWSPSQRRFSVWSTEYLWALKSFKKSRSPPTSSSRGIPRRKSACSGWGVKVQDESLERARVLPGPS